MPTPRGNKPALHKADLLVFAAIVVGLATPAAVLGQSSLPQSSLRQSSLRQSSLRQSSLASVRGVHVLNSKDAVEIEVEGSNRLLPQSQVLTGPDRLVVDFPNALPGNALRNQVVDRGEVKSVRVGLFQSSPPITRVVLDLKTPQSFQVFPYGHTVIIKVTGAAPAAPVEVDDFPPIARPGLVATSFSAAGERIPTQARPAQIPPNQIRSTQIPPTQAPGPGGVPLDVTFHNGLLSIRANKANLSEILFAVHQRTGAEVAVAAGAESEQVAAEYGPGPAPEVLAQLLNGSRFNFLILSAPDNPQKLDRVILSLRGNATVTPLPPMPAAEEEAAPPVAANVPNEPPRANAPPPVPPQNPPETQPDANNTPNNDPN